jgi:hypothetical protein
LKKLPSHCNITLLNLYFRGVDLGEENIKNLNEKIAECYYNTNQLEKSLKYYLKCIPSQPLPIISEIIDDQSPENIKLIENTRNNIFIYGY